MPQSSSESWTYVPTQRYRIFLLFCAAVFLAGGLALLGWCLFKGEASWGPWARPLLIFFGSICLLAAAYMGWGAFRVALTITPGRITVQGPFVERGMNRSEIAGFRALPAQSGVPPRAILVARDLDVKPLIVTFYQPDARLYAWFDGVEDLDAKDLRASQQAVMASHDLGDTPAERAERLKLLRRIAYACNLVGAAILVWAWLFPRPYVAAILACALAPPAAMAIMLWSKGQIVPVEAKQTEARPSVWGLIFAGWGLLLRAILDVDSLDWWPAILAGTVVGVAMSALFTVLTTPDARNKTIRYGLPFLLVPMAWGAVVEANTLLDHSPAQVFQATVLDKHETSGKAHTFDLTLSPWGPRSKAEDVSVDPGRYAGLSVGEKACVYMHPGAFKLRWITVERC